MQLQPESCIEAASNSIHFLDDGGLMHLYPASSVREDNTITQPEMLDFSLTDVLTIDNVFCDTDPQWFIPEQEPNILVDTDSLGLSFATNADFRNQVPTDNTLEMVSLYQRQSSASTDPVQADAAKSMTGPNANTRPASSPSQHKHEVTSRASPRCWEHGCQGRSFKTLRNYNRHLMEQRGLDSAGCSLCGKRFTIRTNRDVHEKKCPKRRSGEFASLGE